MWSEKVSLSSSITPRYRKDSTIGIGMSLIKIGIAHEGDLNLEAIIMCRKRHPNAYHHFIQRVR